jgi:hypothetical protein
MSQFAKQSRFSISLSSTALMISLIASLGACATLDQSRSSMSPATRSASAAPPSGSFFGYVADPADRPAGPSFFGYVADPADRPVGPSFFGYVDNPADRPTGPSFFGYHQDSVARSAPARASQTPVAVQR